MNALNMILSTIGQFLVAVFFLRFAQQAVRASFSNPISQFIVSVTNPLVMPLRKFIPSIKGLDTASLIATVVVQLLVVYFLGFINSKGGLLAPGDGLFATAYELIGLIFGLYWVLIFVRVLLSWINPNPGNPMIPWLYQLTEPLLAPARRLLPPIGGLDLSPVLVLLALGALRVLLQVDLLPHLRP